METKVEAAAGLEPGIRAEVSETVNSGNMASVWGSGALDVYSTPAMIALMEKASVLAVSPFLKEGCSTVGTDINVRHIASSPIGANIRAEGVLTAADGRKLSFEVRAWDDRELIGEGLHERFIIDNKRFMEKTRAKLGG